MISVEKVGGTSMTQFGDVLENIILKDKKNPYGRIFVVSAYSGVTNLLLENKKTKAPGIYSEFVKKNSCDDTLVELEKMLTSLNENYRSIGLDVDKANAFIIDRIAQIKNYLENMAELISSGYVDKVNIWQQAREILASTGEAHSAFNSANIVSNNGFEAVCVDLSGFHDSEYLTIDERIKKEFSKIDCTKVIPIVTGYTKGSEGIMRQFDRGYSEVTFAKIASFLNADEAVIHKEFHFCSADPGIVGEENAHPVCNTNYDIADQLADIWMEAVHPAVSKTLELAGVSLRIKNTFDPDHPGTIFSKDYRSKDPKVEIISGTDNVMVIEIHDPAMVGTVGFDKRIMDFFARHEISYLLKATNANSISIVIRKTDNLEFYNDLRKTFMQVTVKDVAMVCVLGTNMDDTAIIAKAATALAENDITVECISLSLRKVNIQFVIELKDYEKGITVLNKAFS